MLPLPFCWVCVTINAKTKGEMTMKRTGCYIYITVMARARPPLHGPCFAGHGQRKAGGDPAVPQRRKKRRGAAAGTAGCKGVPRQGGAEIRVPDERSGKGSHPPAAECEPHSGHGRPCRPADLDEAGSAWELDMVDKALLQKAVLDARQSRNACLLPMLRRSGCWMPPTMPRR